MMAVNRGDKNAPATLLTIWSIQYYQKHGETHLL